MCVRINNDTCLSNKNAIYQSVHITYFNYNDCLKQIDCCGSETSKNRPVQKNDTT